MMDYTYLEPLHQQIDDISDETIISRTFFKEDHLKGILFGFAPGQELSEHTASVPAVLHFLEGEARVFLGEDEYQAQPGTWIHLPPGQKHSIHAESEVKMLLYLLERA